MKKVLISSALMLAAAISFAGTPKGETKDANEPPSAENAGATVKWFHFTGDASDDDQLNDPSLYTSEASPTCPTNNPSDYRCDIKILSNASGNQPDLSQTIQETRTQVTP